MTMIGRNTLRITNTVHIFAKVMDAADGDIQFYHCITMAQRMAMRMGAVCNTPMKRDLHWDGDAHYTILSCTLYIVHCPLIEAVLVLYLCKEGVFV